MPEDRVTERPSPARPIGPAAVHKPGGAITQLANLKQGHRPGIDKQATKGELVIGRGIQVKGQIGACKTLVVEGELDASVEVETLLLLEGGLFKGTAVVTKAELAGRLEGKLTVQGKLHLSKTARASGEIRYRRIVIEEGGEISGDISVLHADAQGLKSPDALKDEVKNAPEPGKPGRAARR